MQKSYPPFTDPNMAKDDYYTINSVSNSPRQFNVIAVDKDHNVVKTYHIVGAVCDCWAGQKWCRHKQILSKFIAEGLIDSRRYWNHDKKKWLPPIQGAENAG